MFSKKMTAKFRWEGGILRRASQMWSTRQLVFSMIFLSLAPDPWFSIIPIVTYFIYLRFCDSLCVLSFWCGFQKYYIGLLPGPTKRLFGFLLPLSENYFHICVLPLLQMSNYFVRSLLTSCCFIGLSKKSSPLRYSRKGCNCPCHATNFHKHAKAHTYCVAVPLTYSCRKQAVNNFKALEGFVYHNNVQLRMQEPIHVACILLNHFRSSSHYQWPTLS